MLCIEVALDMAAKLWTPAFKCNLRKCTKQANRAFLEKIPEENQIENFLVQA
jgi:hypothetical protein